jgi:hypothetical protein
MTHTHRHTLAKPHRTTSRTHTPRHLKQTHTTITIPTHVHAFIDILHKFCVLKKRKEGIEKKKERKTKKGEKMKVNEKNQ